MHEGKIKGYFDDKATRILLSLEPQDLLLHAGTYGMKEPGCQPVQLSVLHHKIYDPSSSLLYLEATLLTITWYQCMKAMDNTLCIPPPEGH